MKNHFIGIGSLAKHNVTAAAMTSTAMAKPRAVVVTSAIFGEVTTIILGTIRIQLIQMSERVSIITLFSLIAYHF